MSIRAEADGVAGRINLYEAGGSTKIGDKNPKSQKEGIRGWEMETKGLWYKFCKAMDWIVDVKINGKTYVVGKNSLQNFFTRNGVQGAVSSESAQYLMEVFVANRSSSQPRHQTTRGAGSGASTGPGASAAPPSAPQAAPPGPRTSPSAPTVVTIGRGDASSAQLAIINGDSRTKVLPDGQLVVHSDTVASALVTAPGAGAPRQVQQQAQALVQDGLRPSDALAVVVSGASSAPAPAPRGPVTVAPDGSSESQARAVAQRGQAQQLAGEAVANRASAASHAGAPVASSSVASAGATSVTQERANELVKKYLNKALQSMSVGQTQTNVMNIVSNSSDKAAAKAMIQTAFDTLLNDSAWLRGMAVNDPAVIRNTILAPLMQEITRRHG